MSLRIALLFMLLTSNPLYGQTLGEDWGTAEEEAKYYKIVEVPIPEERAADDGYTSPC